MPILAQNAKSEKRDAKREKRDAKYPAIHFLFFAFCYRFHIFHDKCIAGLREFYSFFKNFTQYLFDAMFRRIRRNFKDNFKNNFLENFT